MVGIAVFHYKIRTLISGLLYFKMEYSRAKSSRANTTICKLQKGIKHCLDNLTKTREMGISKKIQKNR